MASLLMTGFPGFLGSALLPKLLARRPRSHAVCLVQPHHMKDAERRLAELEEAFPHVVGRIELITGDMGRIAVLSEYHALAEHSKSIIGKRRDQWEKAMRAMIDEGIADGSVRAVDPKLAAFFFMGAVNWMTRWYRPDGATSGPDIAATFADLLAMGIPGAG